MNNPLISVILPTYNVGRFLGQCIESVSAQTYKNIEIIVIIDGATDNSYDVAKSYLEQEPRLSVYWQENMGSGPARNNGLSKAKGDFVVFVDPDDWLDIDFVEVLLKAQQECNADLVTSGYRDMLQIKDDLIKAGKSIILSPSIYANRIEARENYIRLMAMGGLGSPTKKMYRMSVIKDNGVEFPDLRRSQDIVFNYRYYNYVNVVKAISYVGYNYRILYVDRLLRLKPDYYKTLSLIYRELLALHKSWGVHVDFAMLCNDLCGSVIASAESNYLRPCSQMELLNCDDIQEMISYTRYKSPFKRLFVYFFRRKNERMINRLMGLKIFTKMWLSYTRKG